MKAAEFVKKGQVEIVDVPKPELTGTTDAVIKVVRACVCGSDLWFFRGISDRKAGSRIGHEAIGIVEEVGSDVKNVQPGDFVIVPFTHGCGHCAACLAGFDGDCMNRQPIENAGYQAQYLDYENADGALVKVPGQPSDYSEETLNSLLTLSDIMATGYHAAASAEVKPGDTVVVMGDGAVGLAGILSAKLIGAKRIISTSRHADRQALAKEFGATDNVPERDEEAVQHIMELTDDNGADAILECVGTAKSYATAQQVARPGSIIGRVGIPQKEDINSKELFMNNTGLRGGIAAVTTYDKKFLLDAVLNHKINPGKVFTKSFKLDDIQAAYEAMDKREVIKSLLIMD